MPIERHKKNIQMRQIPQAKAQDSLQSRLAADAAAVRQAANAVAMASDEVRQRALLAAAAAIRERSEAMLAANEADMADARAANIEAPLLDRLELNAGRIERMAEGLEEVAAMPDILGAVTDLQQQPSGLKIGKMRVPLGVIAIIYESRPNVTADAAALCIRAGNACILHGGWEARRSNLAIAEALHAGLQQAGLPQDVVHILLADALQSGEDARSLRHEAVQTLLGEPQWIDMAIPRGGYRLAQVVSDTAKVPVLKHLSGLCHLYVHADADLEMAARLAYNSKCYRYAICGALEALLVDRAVAEQFLPLIATGFAERGVELRGCERSRAIVPSMTAATEQDWQTEYLAPILSVRIVDDLAAAVAVINASSSAHTDSIVTASEEAAAHFLRHVDSSSVMHNAATCYADGKEYGLGAEVGISTDKLHARGPVGVEGLTSQKFVVLGHGEERS